jgi:hypothetical protein
MLAMKYLCEPGSIIPNSIFLELLLLDESLTCAELTGLEQVYLQMIDHQIYVSERDYLSYLKDVQGLLGQASDSSERGASVVLLLTDA